MDCRVVTRIAGFLLLSSWCALAQQPGQRPLGDVARDLRDSKRPATSSRKVYSNENISLSAAEPQTSTDDALESTPVLAEQALPPDGRSPVLDSPKDDTPDDFIVPAGTVVKVDLLDRKVSVPVRVGFATPIPALSKVVIQKEFVCGYSYYAYEGCTPLYRLTHIIIDGKSYPVRTTPNTAVYSEMAFVLDEPLALPR